MLWSLFQMLNIFNQSNVISSKAMKLQGELQTPGTVQNKMKIETEKVVKESNSKKTTFIHY